VKTQLRAVATLEFRDRLTSLDPVAASQLGGHRLEAHPFAAGSGNGEYPAVNNVTTKGHHSAKRCHDGGASGLKVQSAMASPPRGGRGLEIPQDTVWPLGGPFPHRGRCGGHQYSTQ